jgi:hypothetical protein
VPAKAKLTDAEVKKIRRRVQAGAWRSELARAYGVNRKTIQRRLDALELAEAERAKRRDPRGAEAKWPQRLPACNGGKQARALEDAPTRAVASPSYPSAEPDDGRCSASAAARGRTSSARIRPFRPGSHEHWLDERDARVPASPDPRVRLVTESGKSVGSTGESNAARMAAALERRLGPLSVVPA